MAFSFDATIGGTSSNSYCTVEQADDYFGGRMYADNWDSLGDSDKEKVLVMAARRVEAERFAGIKTDQNQSLQFPRTGLTDKEGYIYSETVIPQGVINAQCEMALFYLDRDERLLNERELHDAQFMEHNKIGPFGS